VAPGSRTDLVAGVVAGGVGLGVAELLTGVLPDGRSPVVAVADWVIRHGPPAWEREVIDRLGTADKPALVATVLLTVALLAAVSGATARRWPWAARGIVAATAVAAALAAVAEPDTAWPHALPALLGGVAAWGTLAALVRAVGDRRDQPLAEAGADRRRLLVAGGVAAITGVLGRRLQARTDASSSRAAVTLPAAAERAAAIPAGAELGVEGLSPFVTPNDDFYRIDTSLLVPQLAAETWTLRIDGMVDRPRTYTYEELVGRPLVEADVTLACVSNEVGGSLVGNARWLGLPLRDLLDEVGVDLRADQLVGHGPGGFTAGMPTAAVTDGRTALVAFGMNGEPLPIRHGFPARMVVAGLYGYVSATKWLQRIELTTFDAYDAYWIQRGWAERAPIKVQSRIDTPRRDVAAGLVTVAGVAWAPRRGIAEVEVRVDDGAWKQATLADAPGPDTWRQWRWDWTATAGRHRLQVRATTADGERQTGQSVPSFPDGATGWHTVDLKVA
jgi:DMSO/TMAO reductase YedYZ molybdopterin-dependent catalytic subunit